MRRGSQVDLVFELLPCTVAQVAGSLCALPCCLYPLLRFISPQTFPSSFWTKTNAVTNTRHSGVTQINTVAHTLSYSHLKEPAFMFLCVPTTSALLRMLIHYFVLKNNYNITFVGLNIGILMLLNNFATSCLWLVLLLQ